ncbi:hypothetical protein JL722_3493 [Aureococcus anophagefferens]|nr:hypothetical protein JL722_3493 [Aureococcus anophagefferens]
MAAAWSPVGRYRSCSADSGFSDVDLPPLLGMKQMDLLAHPRNYKSFQERFPSPAPARRRRRRRQRAARGAHGPRAPSRAGTCAFDGARLLLDAAGGGARVVVTLHEGGEGSDEEGNVVGRAVLPAVPAGCLVDKFPLLDAAGAPTGACLTCAVKRVAGYLPPPLYQHALYVYEQRPAPYLGPLLHMNEPWAPLGVSLEAAPAPGAVLVPDVALPEAWARGDGPGGILVADWTLCNTPWAGDDRGWTYSDALGSAAALDTTAADDGRANARRPLAGSPRSAPKGPALGGYLEAAFDEDGGAPPPAFGFPKRHAPRPEPG